MKCTSWLDVPSGLGLGRQAWRQAWWSGRHVEKDENDSSELHGRVSGAVLPS